MNTCTSDLVIVNSVFSWEKSMFEKYFVCIRPAVVQLYNIIFIKTTTVSLNLFLDTKQFSKLSSVGKEKMWRNVTNDRLYVLGHITYFERVNIFPKRISSYSSVPKDISHKKKLLCMVKTYLNFACRVRLSHVIWPTARSKIHNTMNILQVRTTQEERQVIFQCPEFYILWFVQNWEILTFPNIRGLVAPFVYIYSILVFCLLKPRF